MSPHGFRLLPWCEEPHIDIRRTGRPNNPTDSARRVLSAPYGPTGSGGRSLHIVELGGRPAQTTYRIQPPAGACRTVRGFGQRWLALRIDELNMAWCRRRNMPGLAAHTLPLQKKNDFATGEFKIFSLLAPQAIAQRRRLRPVRRHGLSHAQYAHMPMPLSMHLYHPSCWRQ